MTAPEADLTGWTASPFTAEGITHDVYRKGDGPGVVLIPEIPGITPQVLALGNHLVDNGFSVACPSLFGQPGRPLSVGYLVPTVARACVAREFMALAANAERPVARYLRALGVPQMPMVRSVGCCGPRSPMCPSRSSCSPLTAQS